jgi:hypothetical protein
MTATNPVTISTGTTTLTTPSGMTLRLAPAEGETVTVPQTLALLDDAVQLGPLVVRTETGTDGVTIQRLSLPLPGSYEGLDIWPLAVAATPAAAADEPLSRRALLAAAGSSAGDAAAAHWAVVALWWLAQVVALAAIASSGSQNGPVTGPTGTQPHPGTAADGTLPVGPTDD